MRGRDPRVRATDGLSLSLHQDTRSGREAFRYVCVCVQCSSDSRLVKIARQKVCVQCVCPYKCEWVGKWHWRRWGSGRPGSFTADIRRKLRARRAPPKLSAKFLNSTRPQDVSKHWLCIRFSGANGRLDRKSGLLGFVSMSHWADGSENLKEWGGGNFRTYSSRGGHCFIFFQGGVPEDSHLLR